MAKDGHEDEVTRVEAWCPGLGCSSEAEAERGGDQLRETELGGGEGHGVGTGQCRRWLEQGHRHGLVEQ